MRKYMKIIILSLMLLNIFLLKPIMFASAEQTSRKEDAKNVIEFSPDIFLSGSEEELNNITFTKVTLPKNEKDTGIVIALPVQGKGRVHYYIGVTTIEHADIIIPEIFEDPACTIPLKNQYEGDEVYDYFYNFDVSTKGIYYIKLTAPEYNKNEDLPIKFYALYYNGEDRILTQDVQAFCATIDQVPVYYEIEAPKDGTITIAIDNYWNEYRTQLTLCNDQKEEISSTYSVKEDTIKDASFVVKAGKYYMKAINDSDYYRITYHFDENTVGKEETLPKTGVGGKSDFFLGLAITDFGILMVVCSKKQNIGL